MSFAGIWSRSATATHTGFAQLMAALPSRPDRFVRSVAPRPEVMLGHVPFVASEAFVRAPALDERLQLAITGDVRLDARVELLEELDFDGATGYSDNALVLAAYARWQEACVQHLLGDFTFAIHDRLRGRLFAARDVAGARPFYYAHWDGTFAFASNPGTLRALSSLPRDLDRRAVVDYLGDFPEDEAATLLRVVRRLPPGHTLSYDGRDPKVSQFFDVRAVRERRFGSDADYADALRSELDRAVRSRLPTDGQCGVMLSGGLDSSMVTALAARATPHRIATFSAVFDDTPECDERVYQEPVVRAAGTDHHQVRPSPVGLSGDFRTLNRVFGEPIPMGPHWLAWATAEAAVARGTSVLLTGADGDRVVSHGTGRTAELALAGHWRELFQEVRAVHDFTHARVARVLAVHALLPFVPEPWRLFLERHDPRRRALLNIALDFLRPQAIRDAGVAPRLLDAMRRPLSTREAHEQILTNSNRARDVELLDRLGAHLGLEFRHPFYDRRVIELCLSFPGAQKRQRGRARYVLRNAMAGLVPDQVRLRRANTHFDAAFAAWNRPWALALVRESPLNLENLAEFVDVPALYRAVHGFQRGAVMPALGPVDVARRCVLLSKWLDSIGTPKIAPL